MSKASTIDGALRSARGVGCHTRGVTADLGRGIHASGQAPECRWLSHAPVMAWLEPSVVGAYHAASSSLTAARTAFGATLSPAGWNSSHGIRSSWDPSTARPVPGPDPVTTAPVPSTANQ